MEKIKLRVDVFNEYIKEKKIKKDIDVAKNMGISQVQLWRVRLPDDDPRHNDPGNDFIAGVLKLFPDKKFEDLFFLSR